MWKYPRCWLLLVSLFLVPRSFCVAQEPTPSPSPTPVEAESAPVIVSATRIPIPEENSPATVSVIPAEDMEQKQIERVADALRQVPGLSVVQTGAPGQLTSVFTRGLRSEHTQVLLDGIPINQGLQGAFDFATLTTDNIDRIEIVRGPQSTDLRPARTCRRDPDIHETRQRNADGRSERGRRIVTKLFAKHCKAPVPGSSLIIR